MLFGKSPNVEKLEAKRNLKGLVKVLKFEDDRNLRLSAVKALGRIGSSETILPLASTVNDFEENRSVRTAAINALGKIGTPEAIRQLIEMFRLNDEKMLATLEKVLIGLGSQAVEPLITALNHSCSDTRQKTAEILGKIGDPRSALPLTKLIFDENEEEYTAATAVEALGGFEGPVVGLLESILELNQYPLSESAVVALGKIDNPKTLVPLGNAVLKGEKYLRISAIAALAQKGDQAIDYLLTGLRDQDFSVRLAAAEALERVNWQPGIDENAIYYWIAKDNWKRKIPSELQASAVNIFIHHLKKTNPVNENVIEELVKIGKPALASLLVALESGDIIFCKNAAITLGKIGDPRAKEPLINLLSAADEEIRDAAAEALGLMRCQDAFDQLIALFINDHEINKPVLARALGRIGDLRAADPIIKWIFSANSQVPLDVKDMEILFGSYTELILQAVSFSTSEEYISAPNAKYDNYNIIYDQELAHEATAKLCAIKSDISSNILHQITGRRDIKVIIAFQCITYRYGELSFAEQRQMALVELTKRGSPPYNRQAYFNKEAWTL
jgi:HEAT repeat protein